MRRDVRHVITCPERSVTRSAITPGATAGRTRARTAPLSRTTGKGSVGSASIAASAGTITTTSVCSHASSACRAAKDWRYAGASGSSGARKSRRPYRRPRNRAVLYGFPSRFGKMNGGTTVIGGSVIAIRNSFQSGFALSWPRSREACSNG